MRRKCREVKIGDRIIGGNNKILVQTMTNTNTSDIDATFKQIKNCVSKGAEIVRISVPSKVHLKSFAEIKDKLRLEGINIPLVADVHFSRDLAIDALKIADKVRINPGNFCSSDDLCEIEKSLSHFVSVAKKSSASVRVGTNHGSLSDRILTKYGNTAMGMVESTLEYLKIFKKMDFNDVVVGIKATEAKVLINANRIICDEMNKLDMDYPIHLGLTEAGNGDEARIKSALGIGTLLMEGIGDTIRVSLTEDPENEIEAAYNILQASGRRISKTEFIACPACSRTFFDIEKVLREIKQEFDAIEGVKIAVMGCIVNGLGEMANADYAYVGEGVGKISLYRKGKLVKNSIPENEAVNELRKILKTDNLLA